MTGQWKRAACGKLFGALIGRNGIVLQVIERLQLLDQSLYPILAGIGRGEGDHADNRKPEIEAGTKAAHRFDVRRSIQAGKGNGGHAVRTVLIDREVAGDALQIRMRAEVNRAFLGELSEVIDVGRQVLQVDDALVEGEGFAAGLLVGLAAMAVCPYVGEDGIALDQQAVGSGF